MLYFPDYPLPYDDFFYDYTFNEYESLILSHYNLTPILKNDQSEIILVVLVVKHVVILLIITIEIIMQRI